ncbi:MAG: hypothetical protein GXP25_03470 [Planctomycetes bacterium]|nr:hypothetical protein [Planctomycetota bacterium]
MPQILVRNLKPKVVQRLKALARQEGRSLQAEVKMILERAADTPHVDMARARKLCEEFRARFKGRRFSDSAKLIRKDRDR